MIAWLLLSLVNMRGSSHCKRGMLLVNMQSSRSFMDHNSLSTVVYLLHNCVYVHICKHTITPHSSILSVAS